MLSFACFFVNCVLCTLFFCIATFIMCLCIVTLCWVASTRQIKVFLASWLQWWRNLFQSGGGHKCTSKKLWKIFSLDDLLFQWTEY